ncbi:bifunctional diguanylate cyclase/phosphodiesterase [Shewanella psychromarinicola]|uniref:cyclic-guanylate-specific phosphodiesterase n=1 Tax=Shewanella psychromarinicola TaxID=2487742 RepID=A0A3N4DZ70_9GAMM|nr:EAL domain-containing protein [Shewanella psychromarinicola]AZG35471.1 EAL domain-containing protein [Shewanella psychromarinicola]MCL1084240.1 EAL domain-containing protein [Shewanella psychromarinicola]RPA31205.1 EAL domain-containing protein [Shewanella psychromarinicola]
MRTWLKNNLRKVVCSSIFLSSLAFLSVGSFFALLRTLLAPNEDIYNVTLPLNAILLLACTALSLIAIIRKNTALLVSNLSIMLIILFLSLPFVSSNSILNFSMPYLQLVSWILLILGLTGRFKKTHFVWNWLSQVSFAILASLMLALLLTNSSTLGNLQFGVSPPQSINIAIFILFSSIAGFTVPSILCFNIVEHSRSFGSWLAVLLTVSTILLWLNFMHQLEVSNQKIVNQTILKFQQQTEQLLDRQKGLMARLGDRLSLSNVTYQPQQLSLDLNTYLRDFNYFDYIAVLDNIGNVYYSAAQSKAIKQWYDRYLVSEYPLLSTRANSRAPEDISFYYNDEIDYTFVRVQLSQPNAFDLSTIIAGINFKQVMQSTIPFIVPTGYAITLAYEKKEKLLFNQLDSQQKYFRLGAYDVNSLSVINWDLELYRDFDIELNYVMQVSEVVLMTGWLACFLALLSHQYQNKIQWQQKRLLAGYTKLRNSLTLQHKFQTHHLQIMENSADLLCIIDTDGKFVEVSNSSFWVLGYPAKELNGRMFMDFVHPDDRGMTGHEAETITSGQKTKHFRNRYIRKDGNVVHLMWSARYEPGLQTMYGVARDISDLVKAERFQQAQQYILQLISVEAPVVKILKQICLMAEENNSAVKACVMLKVEQHLEIASAPSFSQNYHSALADVPIANNSGSCGSAAFRKSVIIIEDIATDPKRPSYADVVLTEKLHASWSMPILLDNGNILGTFALYCKSARAPSSQELELMTICCHFTANAIERSLQKQLLIESEQRFRSLCQLNPDSVFILDDQGYFTNMNKLGCNLLELPLPELKRMHFNQVIFNEKLGEVSQYFARTLSGESMSFDTSILSRSGRQHELQITIIPTLIGGKITGVIGIGKDITQRLQTEKQLRLFKRAVDASSNGVAITEITKSDKPIVYVNNAFEKLTGYSLEESVGRDCQFLQGKERDPLAIRQIRSAIQSKQETRVILKNYRKDGRVFWNNLFLSPVPNDVGVITHYVGIQTDITEQIKFKQELAFNASHDLLTGLPNRNLLRDRLLKSLKSSARHNQKVAILCIDLDGFHLMDDNLGHLNRDDVIHQISTRINSQIRSDDTLASMGGDELVLLMADHKDINQLNAAAERMLTMVSTPLNINGQELQLTASIGISISISDDDIYEPMKLVKQAGLAMYQAKQLGSNNVQWYNEEMETSLNKRQNLRVMLKQAIVNQEFELYYQPQVEAGSGRLIGLEALLRWRQPDLGLIGPDEFIPIAEEMGLIVEIGQWVIEQAASYNRSLQERGLVKLIMAVNLSSLQFEQEDFVEQLEETLKRVKLAPKWFELELTESLLLANIEEVVYKLQHLKQLGISIAIDDFGTGYSSLSYLKRLPIDKLKIDKSFIRELVTDQKDAAITRAIIALAHQLGLKVIAEGIETKPQATLLHKSLCDELQGYFFSKPLPTDKLEIFLQHYLPCL